MAGLKGYLMFLVATIEGWTVGEVKSLVLKVKEEMSEPRRYVYVKMKRVWVLKPLKETRTV